MRVLRKIAIIYSFVSIFLTFGSFLLAAFGYKVDPVWLGIFLGGIFLGAMVAMFVDNWMVRRGDVTEFELYIDPLLSGHSDPGPTNPDA